VDVCAVGLLEIILCRNAGDAAGQAVAARVCGGSTSGIVPAKYWKAREQRQQTYDKDGPNVLHWFRF
jgi:hypothetical protein